MAPVTFNLRSRVHEYGGRAFAARGDVVVAAGFADQRLYLLAKDALPRPLTPESGGRLRYADLVLDLPRGRVLAVREDHRDGGEPRNEIVAVPLAGDPHEGVVLSGAHDFVAYPRLSPDGRTLAWIAWNHPAMPWDGTELWLADLDVAGATAARRLVAGGPNESLVQPEWSPNGRLHVVSDRSGWWNLYRVERDGLVSVCPVEGELAGPLWQLGARWYDFLDDRTAMGILTRDGGSDLVRLDLAAGTVHPLDLGMADLAGISCSGGRTLVQALPADAPARLLLVGEDGTRTLATSGEAGVDAAYFTRSRPIAYPSADGRTAHALFYPPANPEFEGPPGTLPPLVVRTHGGPTGRASAAFSLAIQFWTSRGFAVVDVDYGGSTGYGRAYRRLLDGTWGIVDVEDCVAAVRHLAAEAAVDGDRVAIRGGSAGGYTTLCALTFTDAFKAGASAYGIGDLEALARDTHKFESRYLDRLIGPWPEAAEVYRARSPIHHVDGLSCPVIFLQGLDDKVVPPNQAETMVAALRRKGITVAYLTFAGEGHGFRMAATMETALLAEFAFFCRVFGIAPADAMTSEVSAALSAG
ncbi:MAG: S9 family peptidase [Geminicoccaceae bacterium]